MTTEAHRTTEGFGAVSGPHVLRNYAFIADGERGAVLGPDGEIAWLCFPGWDGDPLFGSLLGGPGRCLVRPTERFVWGGQYEEGTLIWRNRWLIGGDIVECQELLAFPGRSDHAILVRRVHAKRGKAELDVLFDASRRAGFRRTGEYCWEGRVRGVAVRWWAEADLDCDGTALSGQLRVERGAYRDLVLELGADGLPDEPAEASQVIESTSMAWRRMVPDIASSTAARDARHAVAVLRGLTGCSGAMVAAATTSLPERADEGRNYDYRYAWIRDQCYSGVAAATDRGAADALLDNAVRFVHERLLDDGPHLRPVYRTDGTVVPDQTELDLPGYPGAPRVMEGNRAGSQFQLDCFGEALNLFAAAARLDRMHGDAWRAARIAAEAIERRWTEPDSGVWELPPERYAHSRLLCAAGLRALARAVPAGAEASRWLALADTIVADVAGNCTHRSGRWQRSPGDPRADAALLLAALRGAVPPSDPRSRATLAAVRNDLVVDGYTFRYVTGHEPPGQAEGAFLLCGFWLALACHQAGDHVAAVRSFERNRAACGPAGLFTEEYDVHQRQLRGNFPQAFVHALLLEASVALGRPPE